MYAGTKLALQNEADLTRVYEVRELDELTDEWLQEKLSKQHTHTNYSLSLHTNYSTKDIHHGNFCTRISTDCNVRLVYYLTLPQIICMVSVITTIIIVDLNFQYVLSQTVSIQTRLCSLFILTIVTNYDLQILGYEFVNSVSRMLKCITYL